MKLTNLLKYFYWERIYSYWKESNTKKIISISLFSIIIVGILFSNFIPKQVTLSVDEVAKRNITSNVTAVIVDEEKTEELRQQAIDNVQKVYQEDKYALSNARSDVNYFFSKVSDIIMNEEGIDEEIKKDVETLLIVTKPTNLNLSLDTSQLANYLITTSEEDLERMREVSLEVVTNYMDKPITEEALTNVLNEALNQIENLPYAEEAREVIKIASINVIRPNMIFNQEATERAIQEAKEAVQPVQKTIKSGEIIVREGDRVTQEQISTLEQLGIQRTKSYPIALIGAALFVLLTIWLLVEYMKRYYEKILKNDKQMLLIGLIFIIVLLFTRILTAIEISDRPEINALIGYLAPVAAGSMTIAILIDNRLAYFMTMLLALYVGLITTGNQVFFAITAFVGGTVGVYRVSKLSQTSDLARSGVYIALANIITITGLSLIAGNVNLDMLLIGILLGGVSGILSAVLMIGALPYLESAFSITSMIKLLELSNPNHPLLKRLLLEAPGTYHHSLLVGNLAEASAEDIAANPLLVRVGAYYHDIGKIKRPEYFVENQRGFENPHEKIAPALSALIITSHVKEGVELAKEARLPQIIIDFIEQHQGTGLAKYFYSRALEEDREGNISEDSFRYEGPKPQTKEIALVMLADAAEAAVRSLNAPTPENIKEMVTKIIKEKLNDGQLDECDLTFKDLDIISNSFCKILDGVYHKRIEYPDTIVREFEKRREHDGDNDN
ncbi:hydrolase [Candidatus Syntrophocurvum alkaliphilum]|uniref:Hydrolase n=1 Tax=Candidatus Syntrophocurvum alkaliphilum TaxID=2293317 RepID=A0A6I6DBF7_9FIRM|nr:HDIG domain-containing metalloprotein [Candidatus Syntrophocurvum alkaliphilum]QGT99985.1 hydrolase [Candidatus Syntrophocurvum alkaliphilum]